MSSPVVADKGMLLKEGLGPVLERVPQPTAFIQHHQWNKRA
jgi:hypothetical protein